MMSPTLVLREISKSYGSLCVVDSVSLEVQPGERLGIIGPNGAGKTTLFSIITGRLAPSSGRVVFNGHDITATREDRRSRLGIAQTFQRSSLFPGLTLLRNVMLSVQRSSGTSYGMIRAAHRHRDVVRRAEELLGSVGLADRASDLAAALSHGERRQLELALALACEPSMILFDEPVAGLSSAETASFVALMRALPEQITVLLIEHDIDVVMALASRMAVLDAGRLLADGDPRVIAADEAVREAYLGKARTDDLFREG